MDAASGRLARAGAGALDGYFTPGSPSLRWMPEPAPASWVLQVLGLFFTGGFGAARSTTPWC